MAFPQSSHQVGRGWEEGDRISGLAIWGAGSRKRPCLTLPSPWPVRALQGLRGPHGQPRPEHGAPGPRRAGGDPGPAGVLHEGKGHPPEPPARGPGELPFAVSSPHTPCLPLNTHLWAWPRAGGWGPGRPGEGPEGPRPPYSLPSLAFGTTCLGGWQRAGPLGTPSQ